VSKPSAVKKSESKPEKVDNVGNGKSVIQLAALSTAPRLMHSRTNCLREYLPTSARCKPARVKSHRAGCPFASRAEAEAALRKLSRAGISGIVVSK
jgi:DedD protein